MLRDVYVRGKYRDVILPMTVIRRLDVLLEPTKTAVLQMKTSLDAANIANQEQNPGTVFGERCEMPGAIVESLFISNDADAYFLASDAGHEAIVTAYEAAIVQYFNEFPG